MKILTKTELSEEEKTAVLGLINECQAYEQLSLSFPYDEEDTAYYLCYSDNALVSIMATMDMGDGTYEISAWTLPEERKKGYFKALLSELKAKDLILVTDENSKTISSVLSHMDARLINYEYEMHMILTDSVKQAESSQPDELSRMAKYSIIPYKKDKTAYLYEFEIRPEFRGQGKGKSVFAAILKELYEQGYRNISLQVSSDNTPAFKIYKSSGLTVGAKIGYYRLAK